MRFRRRGMHQDVREFSVFKDRPEPFQGPRVKNTGVSAVDAMTAEFKPGNDPRFPAPFGVEDKQPVAGFQQARHLGADGPEKGDGGVSVEPQFVGEDQGRD